MAGTAILEAEYVQKLEASLEQLQLELQLIRAGSSRPMTELRLPAETGLGSAPAFT